MDSATDGGGVAAMSQSRGDSSEEPLSGVGGPPDIVRSAGGSNASSGNGNRPCVWRICDGVIKRTPSGSESSESFENRLAYFVAPVGASESEADDAASHGDGVECRRCSIISSICHSSNGSWYMVLVLGRSLFEDIVGDEGWRNNFRSSEN